MKKLNCVLASAVLGFQAFIVSAAVTAEDASNIGTAETPQQVDQSKAANKMDKKATPYKKRMGHKNMDMKMMDTNNDGMVSKNEFMTYHEQKFDKMKQTDGMVSIKDMQSGMHSGFDKSSMNNKPIGTTTDNPNVNPADATNGKKY